MIEHLSVLISNFPGAPNQTRCFTHILNLVAKSILRQFEVPKKKGAEDLGESAAVLAELTKELELDEPENFGNEFSDDEDELNLADENNDDGLGDERDGMSEEEVANLEESLVPVRLLLTKVS